MAVGDDRALLVELRGRILIELSERNIDRSPEMLFHELCGLEHLNKLRAFRNHSTHLISVKIGWHNILSNRDSVLLVDAIPLFFNWIAYPVSIAP
jgi:hypothetical protein